MMHTVFAVFDDEAAAAAAVADLESRGTPRSHCEVVVHRGTLASEELHAGESASRRGAVTMAAAGTALGALAAGLIAGPIAGAAFAALVGGTIGGLMGGFMGLIAGSSSPDSHLAQVARELDAGKIVVTVEAPGFTPMEGAEIVMRLHGARVTHRQRP